MSPKELPLSWLVVSDYVIEDLRVRPIQMELDIKKLNVWKHSSYLPTERPELPGEIAKLERGDHAAVIKFARRYGLLGFSELSMLDPNERLRAGKDKVPYGDPLKWVWLHAETLGLCLTLKDLIDHDETDRLVDRLLAYPQLLKRRDYPTPIITFGSRENVREKPFLPVTAPTRVDTIRNLAANILCYIVNDNIAQLHPIMGWAMREARFLPHFQADALIEVAYWHMANALQGGTLQRCEAPNCGQLFIQTHAKQRFCPTGTKKESSCAVLVRVRRRRVKVQRIKQKENKQLKGRKYGTKKR